jgi:hypothetical protein
MKSAVLRSYRAKQICVKLMLDNVGAKPIFTMTPMDPRIAELVARLAALERERAEIVAEINTLRSLRSEEPARVRAVPLAKAGDSIDRNSTIEKKIALFRRLFRGRSDVFPIRWENRTTGRSGYAPACANEWQRGICEKPKVKCSACPNQAFQVVDDVAVERHLRGVDANGAAPRSLWASIRCLRTIPVRSWLRISTKGIGEEMFPLLGRPVSATKFLLPLSGRDPETVRTLGFFSRNRYWQRRRGVSGHSLSPTRWNVSPISDSGPTIGFFRARIPCQRVASVIWLPCRFRDSPEALATASSSTSLVRHIWISGPSCQRLNPWGDRRWMI